jgi:CheY-like chemotaxis protein
VKFTPPGGSITVSLQPAGENAVICVEDTGSGISESDQAMIFQRFYRAQAADTNHVSGAGIGLALVAEAARACGGSVDVTSRPGHGTCFWVTLPARRPAPGEMIRPARVDLDRQRLDLEALQSDRESLDNPDPAPGPPVSATAGSRGSVLVVEDNADLRQYLAQSLAPHWRVEQAVDGVRGFALAREKSPDLIITDLMMPNADGFEMLARLREDIETSHIPVLFLTARQDNSTRLKAFTLSADAFLSKPFELDELKIRLEQMLSQRERIRAHLVGQIGRAPEPRDEPGHQITYGI